MRRRAIHHPNVPSLLAQRAGWVLLVLCLLLAQSIGLAHRSLHGYSHFSGVAHHHPHAHLADHLDDHAHDPGHDHAQNQNNASLLTKLFAQHEDGDTQCQLMDGFTSFDALKTYFAGIKPAQIATTFIAFNTAQSVAREAALFHARGPPLFL